MNRGLLAVLGALLLFTLITRLPGLGQPEVFVFDEIYYANDALDIVTDGVETTPVVHPAGGKVMLALGIRVLGFNSVGWRAVPLIAGVAVVLLTAVVVWRRSVTWQLAALAGLLVAVDGVAFWMGRLAMLDGLLALFIVLMVLLLVPVEERSLSPPELVLLGVVLGIALAIKWTALLVVPVGVLAVGWAAHRDTRLRDAAVAVTIVGVAMVGSYAALHAGWIANADRSPACVEDECPGDVAGRVGNLFAYQSDKIGFHAELEPENRYAVAPWKWWTEPTVLFEGCDQDGPEAPGACDVTSRLVALSNPLLWIAAAVGLVAMAVQRRFTPFVWICMSTAVLLLLPWLITGRGAYSFYAAPVVPVLAILVSEALAGEEVRPAARIAAGSALGLFSIVFFMLFV